MAASSISMLALLLLMSAVTPGLSTEGEGSLDHTATVLIIAMKQVIQALDCFGDTVQEGLRQQRQCSDVLTDLHTLPAAVLRVEERINQHDGKIDSLKEKIEDIAKVGDLKRLLDDKTSENERNVDKLDDLRVKFEAKSRESDRNLEKVKVLTQEIEDLKNQLQNKNQTVGDLKILLDDKTSENERNVDKLDDLRVKFEAKSRESDRNLEKVQDLGRNLDESRRYAEKLEQLVQQLNNTLESKKTDVPGCAEQPPQKIRNLVLQYIGSRDWPTLKKGLDAEMDHSSDAYGELNLVQFSIYPHWYIGYNGYTQLATLLLCAGMPVDMYDKDNYKLLNSAVYGGHYQLVKMLVSRGADVNTVGYPSQTPLQCAASKGHLEMVKLLVEAGADTTATDTYGRNALYWAKYNGHTAVQQYLEQFPA